MIVIGIFKNTNNQINGFKVFGHANYKPSGEDIVCAAVSVLSQTALLGLHDYAGIKIVYSIDEETGSLDCFLPPELSEKQRLMANAILETMVLGLKNLENSYPNHMRIFKRRWIACC